MFALVRSPRLGTDNICNLIVHRLDADPQHHLNVADVLQIRFDADDYGDVWHFRIQNACTDPWQTEA